MTLIAGMWDVDGESILIGADSGVVDVTGTAVFSSSISSKLKKHQDGKTVFAWGIAGDRTLGERCSEAMISHPWPSDWYTFQEHVTQMLAGHIGFQRNVITQSGSQLQQDDLIQLLLVGYVDNALRLLTVDERGVLTLIEYPRPEDLMRTRFSAIGGGAVHAKAIHIAFSKGMQRKNDLDSFREVMNLTADYAFGIAKPIHIYRVSKESIQGIS